MFNIIATGQSVRGVDIPAYTNMPGSDLYTYLIAGVHGDEGEGIFVLEQLHVWLNLEDPQVPLLLIPLLNPDGLEENARINANGVDLNRNWPTKDWSPAYSEARYNPGPEPLSEPENQFLADLFAKYPPKY